MNVDYFFWPIVGGLLIGGASALLFATLGRIAGISGIFFSLFNTLNREYWRFAFILGLPLGAWIFHTVSNKPIPIETGSWFKVIIAGLLVGIGVKLGSGCTSGHGICGLSRLSPRSFVATITFMLTAAITVFFIRHIF